MSFNTIAENKILTEISEFTISTEALTKCLLVSMDPRLPHVYSKNFNQIGHLTRLIAVFTRFICHLAFLVILGSINP